MSVWDEPLTPAERADVDRYEAAMHAVQSGVKAEHELGSDDGSPKHLRVGINSAIIQTTALVRLLVDAGAFSRADWWRALADETHRERQRYEAELSDRLGRPVSLE